MSKIEENSEFISFDEEKIFYRKYSDETWNKKVVIVLHRGHEHSKRLEDIINDKRLEGYRVYSYDYRGHGYTKAKATYEFMNLVRDLNAFVNFICQENNIKQEQIFIIANSVAGVVASTWIHDYAPKIAGVALVAPAFKIKLYFPFAKEFLNLAIKFKKDLNIKSYVKAKYLTKNTLEQEKYNADELITPDIPAKQLVTLLDTAKRVVDDANLISCPTLVLSAQKDYVVDDKIQGDFFSRLSSKTKKLVPLKDSYHGVLYDLDKNLALNEIFNFMEKCFTLKKKDYLSKKIRITEDEKSKILYGNESFINRVSYFFQKKIMHNLGFLSEGISIGLKYGFDSGVTLDYVYENEAKGKSFIGKSIDRNYLDSIGWKGIRQRKINMKKLLVSKIEALLEENKEIKILDIAGGPARYLIEIAKEYPQVSIFVQDYQIQNIEKGKELASKENLENIKYKQADAFDKKTYKDLNFTPNIVIVSGVFELFSDNNLINKAIKGISSIIEANGYLLYTGQPWHPQLEQIANVLGNHQQEKWVMRRRSQYELDTLFEKANFKKDNMLIDNWGIFTVSSSKIKKNNV
ncbi:bifunctional alpha/beta hydrolase/class I SAM-dependent methyltransferase [Arcobacter sp. LA11]|uniref:bifunctional alpha/beta hydrolase/class I SAM-dependent methyltransferase n=1 Tax=Arcobacter sp. LA11 TaxID=1898176 RepID=UPI0009321F57|nr:bifunctional alpha/beta hydrolase/class I SAM-dependent methyltransferase [Arcobacter sp. LA11]